VKAQSVHELGDFRRIDAGQFESDIDAIQEAIDDMDQGDAGISFEEFDRDFRARRMLPTRP